MNVDIRFKDSFPEHARDETREIIERWAPLFCRVVNRVYVSLEDLENATAYVRVSTRYRECTIAVSAEWLGDEEGLREEVLVHELAHITVTPIQQVLKNVLALVGDEAAALASEWAGEATESVVEDLARAVLAGGRDA